MRTRVGLAAAVAMLLAGSLSGWARTQLPVPPVRPQGPSVTARANAVTAGVDWTQFRFDQDRTGVQPFETILNPLNVQFLELKWQAQLGMIVDYSSPAIVNGVAYIGSYDGRLWAYPADGCGTDICTEPLWKSNSLALMISSPTVVNGQVYVGSQTSFDSNDGRLDVFDADGCGDPICYPKWQGLVGLDSVAMSSPAVANGLVYIGGYDGTLYVFNADGCGALLCPPVWTGPTDDHIVSSPTVSGNTVFIGSNDNKLYAFAANGCGSSTCDPVWTGDAGEPIFESSPAIYNGTIYIASVHHINAFPLAGCGSSSCQPLWQGSFQESFINGSPAVYSGRVYIGTENTIGVYDANGCGQPQCGPLWLDFAGGSQPHILSSPTIANGVLYVGKMNGELIAWPTEPCGDFLCYELWKYMTHHVIVNSSPAVVDGKIYLGGANSNDVEQKAGRLYVFALP